jgi:uncharacterized protein
MFLRRDKRPLKQQIKHAISPANGYRRAIEYVVIRLKRRPGTPEYIAKGFAIGVAINYWPILFTHLIFGYILCRMLRGDLIAMVIGTLLGNPWTFAIVYPLSYKLGKTLLGMRPSHSADKIDTVSEVWAQIWPVKSMDSLAIAFQEIIIPMILGGFLLALPSAILGYYVAKNAVNVYQLQRRRKLTKKFEAVEAEIEQPPEAK